MDLRHEAMLMLDKRGAVLETARAVSRILHDQRLRGAVIGGVAVVLHGHVRTTSAVDVLIDRATDLFDDLDVPVHLVPQELVALKPTEFVEIEQVTTVRLADLISMKLHTGTKQITRAQDIADVIGLIREHRLTSTFASQIDRPMRDEFRKLVKAVRNE